MKQIAFLTDVHLNERFPIDHNINPGKNLEKVLTDLSERNIKEIIFGGDIGECTSHPYFFDALKPFSVNLILGNHDKLTEVGEFFNHDKDKEELYYKSENKYFKFIFLDSSSEEVTLTQLEWVKSEINTNKKLVIFIHHPVVEINTAIDRLYPLKNRELLKSVLTENEREIILFCGHYHMNDERTFKNLKQFTTQSLSFQVVKNADELIIDNSTFGYRIINLDAQKIETELVCFKTEQENN